jgi:hypothetical protein
VVLSACRGASAVLPSVDDDIPADAPLDGTAPEPSEAGGAAAPAESVGVASAGQPADADPPDQGSALEGCGAEPVTLEELHSGRVRGDIAVAPGPLSASSQKFLVSEAKSGSCLWGAFAADPSRTGAGSGLLLVSYGAPHADGQACAPGSDGLPDDLKPGDSLLVEGRLDEYVPAACNGVAPALQLRVDAACPVRRARPGPAPEAAVIERELADRLAGGKDAGLLRDWGGALVKLEGVTALEDPDDGDAVFPFGVIRLAQTSLEVHSRLYYFDLSLGGPRDAAKTPRYGYPTTFRSVSGVVFLDYCSWVLAPRDRCTDLTPADAGCSAQAARP